MYWILVLVCSAVNLSKCHEALDTTTVPNNSKNLNSFAASSLQRYIVCSFFKVNWFQANQICHRSGMILATANSFEHHLQIIRAVVTNGYLLGLEEFWLGASNLGDLRRWTWLGTGVQLGYKKWASEEPKSDSLGHDGCLVMGLDESWYSEKCDDEHYFVCERSCNTSKYMEPLYM